MNLTYKARYYTAQASRPFVADVSLRENGIDIMYYDEHGHYRNDHWTKELIVEKHVSSSNIILQYGSSFPCQQLEITDLDFIKTYRLQTKRGSTTQWFNFSTKSFIVLLIGGFVSLVVLCYFFVLPFIADRVANHFPIEYEISMGEKMYDNILAQSVIDTIQTEAINHFFTNLNVKSVYPVRITVVKDTVVNAYALPGGGIIVYDAIIKTMHTPEELAALLSHEYSHVALKHTTHNVFRSLAGYLFISMVFSDANGLTNMVINNANQLQNLSYSRELEHEADENGLQILKANAISSEGMIELFNTLQQQNSTEVDEIVSTHPDIENRILFVEEFTKQNPYKAVSNDSLTFYFNKLKHH